MVSAMKVGGRRLYELARRGEEVERAPRRVRIDRIEVEEFEPGAVPGRDRPGRVLQRNLRAVAGCRPRRTRSAASRTSASCAACVSVRSRSTRPVRSTRSKPNPDSAVLSPAVAMRDLEQVSVDAEQARAVAHGATFPAAVFAGANAGRRPVRGRRARRRVAGGVRAAAGRRQAGRGARTGRGDLSRARRHGQRRRGPGRGARRPAPSSRSARSTACTSVTKPCCASCASSPTRVARGGAGSRSTAIPPKSCDPDPRPKLLTTLEQKLELLDATGDRRRVLGAHVRRGAQQGAGGRLRARGARRPGRRAVRGRRRRLPLRLPPPRRRAAAPAHGGRARVRSARPRPGRGRGRRHRRAVLVDPNPRAARQG